MNNPFIKKYSGLVVILLLAMGITLSSKGLTTKVVALLGLSQHTINQQEEIQTQKNNSIEATGFQYAELIKQNIAQNKTFPGITETNIGITSHHLPTAADLISKLYITFKETAGPRDTFVVIGPDHTEKCKAFASTADLPYQTPYGQLENNTDITTVLVKAGVSLNNECFIGEHSIGIQALYIKYLFPNARVVPITYSSAAGEQTIQMVVNALAPYKDTVTVVVSVDFSHYQSTAIANRLDADSGKMIEQLNGSGLTLKHMDSPPSIQTAIALAKAWNLNPLMLRHANSFEFNGQSENTTGYWDILFSTAKK
jgi:AmmeMemoRadiSam system protein B